MSGVSVVIDGYDLKALSPLTDLKWTRTYPGGLSTISWSMPALDKRFTHPLLERGALCRLMYGPVPLGQSCVLAEPDRTSWSFTAAGIFTLAANFPALAADVPPSGYTTGLSVQTTDPDDATDYAIASLGLTWAGRRGSLGAAIVDDSTTDDSDLSTSVTLADLYAQACSRDGTQWVIGADDYVQILTPPAADAAPDWIVVPDTLQMGTADDDYYSDLYGLYQLTRIKGGNPVTLTAVAHVFDAASRERFGTRSKIIDLTARGANSDTSTTGANEWTDTIVDDLTARLAKSGGRLGYTSQLDLLPHQLLSPGGVEADPNLVTEGQKVRVFGVADPAGNASPGLFTDLIIGTADRSADDPGISITPVGFNDRNLTGLLADSVAEDPVEIA